MEETAETCRPHSTGIKAGRYGKRNSSGGGRGLARLKGAAAA